MANSVNDLYYQMFNRPRAKNEIDLVTKVYELIKKNSGKKHARKFIQDKDILIIKDLNPISQRVIINKYFSTSLFKIRHNNNIRIANLLTFLVNDGTETDWLKIMENIFIPELKNKKIDIHIFK